MRVPRVVVGVLGPPGEAPDWRTSSRANFAIMLVEGPAAVGGGGSVGDPSFARHLGERARGSSTAHLPNGVDQVGVAEVGLLPQIPCDLREQALSVTCRYWPIWAAQMFKSPLGHTCYGSDLRRAQERDASACDFRVGLDPADRVFLSHRGRRLTLNLAAGRRPQPSGKPGCASGAPPAPCGPATYPEERWLT